MTSNQEKEYRSSYNSDYRVDVSSKETVEHIDHERSRYPYCVVWTPIPVFTWLLPIIGHIGIATSTGIIRDFAGPYFVSEDDMGFGKPTRYWNLYREDIKPSVWDNAISEASEEYKNHMHNICCDNCHSHVAMAMNLMRYRGSSSWNMFKLCALTLVCGRFVGCVGFLRTWLPAVCIYGVIAFLFLFF